MGVEGNSVTFCYRGLRGASFLKSNWVRVYRKGVLKSQCAVVRGCEHCEETKCCRFRNSCGTLCGLHCTAPHPLSLVARVCCGVVPAQLHRTHSGTLSRRARVLRRCPRTTPPHRLSLVARVCCGVVPAQLVAKLPLQRLQFDYQR